MDFLHSKRKLFIFLGIVIVVIVFFIFRLRIFSTLSSEKHLQKDVSSNSLLLSDAKEISHGNMNKKQVIFTFDGGSTTQSANRILEILAKHHLKGTFFLTGKMIETNPDLVKRIVAENHEIFNHTFDHPYLTKLPEEKIKEELVKMDEVLLRTVGISSKPYFRAPYGERNEMVLAAAARAGYRSVFWTVDALDWKESEGETAEKVKQRIISNISPGTIYLMHIGDNITGAILDDVFTAIESRGYKIVSLTEGM